MPRINDYTLDSNPPRTAEIQIAQSGSSFRMPISALSYIVHRYKMLPAQNEMLGTAAAQLVPFTTLAIGVGSTCTLLASVANHPGIWRIVSAGGVGNTGFLIGILYASSVLIGGGEVGEFVVRWPATTNLVSRIGFYDENTLAANPTDGAWFDLAGTTLSGKTANNTAISTTGSTYTITANTWYRVRVEVNAGATRVDFYLYSEAGALLWTDGLTTNIPTAAGRETDFRAGAIKTSVGGANILDVDYMSYWRTQPLTR